MAWKIDGEHSAWDFGDIDRNAGGPWSGDGSAAHQIADRIQEAIAEGKFRQGQQLPPGPTIARRYKVATGTVHEALRLLQDRGVVRSHVYHGTFVRGVPTEDGA